MVDTRQFAASSDKSLLGVDGALRQNDILQNRYKIEGVLGVGGMGSVYQARDMQFPEAKRFVAVKEMLQQSNDPEIKEQALRNFQREANILAGLSHPAIPTIHDYFSTKERAYLVMEFINGSDLDSILNRHEGFLPVNQVIEWAVTLCDVLSYLHTSDPPIIFRDIKPSNIMIDVYGRLRLIDFGIAKTFDPGRKGTMIGTEGYAAPESYRGLATPASDIFGVGATLHHLLTRDDPRMHPPFTFHQRPIPQTNPSVTAELDALVMKALAYNGEERFASAEEMKKALEAFLHKGRPINISVGPSPAPNETTTWDAEVKLNTGIEPIWKFKVEEEIRSTPIYCQKLVMVTAYDNNLYALDAQTGAFKWKYAAEDVVASSPAVSESDSLVVFGSKDQTLYAVDFRTGRIRWTFQAKGPIYASPTIKHGHVFVGSDDGNLYAIRLSTGRQAWKQDVHDPIRAKAAVTEERVLCGTDGGEMLCIDLSGQIKWRFRARKGILSSPVIHQRIAYFGAMDGHIYAVDLENGWSAWKVQTSKPIVSSPAIGMDRLFIGSVNGLMYALDLETGKERWKFDTKNQITSSPRFVGDAVYFGANDGKVYCLEAKTGKERWSFQTQGLVPGSAEVVDGVLYIGSTDHYLYALKA